MLKVVTALPSLEKRLYPERVADWLVLEFSILLRRAKRKTAPAKFY
jgi:hypothetical protein